MRIEIRTKDHVNIEMDVEAIRIELEPLEFCHEFFRLVENPKYHLKLFYHGAFIDDVSKVFEYESGSGTLCRDKQSHFVVTKERGMAKGPHFEVDDLRAERKADSSVVQEEKKPLASSGQKGSKHEHLQQ
jgi:hypothetical protein